MLPAIAQYIKGIGVAAICCEYERGTHRNVVSCVGHSNRWGIVAIGCEHGAVAAVASDVVPHFVQAERMEIVVAVILDVVAAADASISLDSRTATRFHGCSITLVTTATSLVTVEGVPTAKLMAYFVRYIVHVKRIADGVGKTSYTTCLIISTSGIEVSDPPTAC